MRTRILIALMTLPVAIPAEPSLQEQIDELRGHVNAKKESGEASDAKPLAVGLQATAFYRNSVGAGDDAAAVPLNRAALESEVDFTFEGAPNAWSTLFTDLRLDPVSGQPGAFEAWLQLQPWGERFTLRGGLLDLTGVLDASAIANDEKTQFVRAEFVDSPLLGTPDNGPALLLWLGKQEGPNLKLAVQTARGPVDPADDLYLAAELEAPYEAWRGGSAKLWYRESGRPHLGPVPALGLVWDQHLSASLSAFSRAAYEFSARGLEHDPETGDYQAAPLNGQGASGAAAAWTLSAGLETRAPIAARPDDSAALAWGTTRADDGSSADYVEAYYKAQFGPNLLFSLHYQADFSRLQAPVANDYDADASTDFVSYAATDSAHQILLRVTANC